MAIAITAYVERFNQLAREFNNRLREEEEGPEESERSGRYIFRYEYRPKWTTHGPQPWFGLELEIEKSCPTDKPQKRTLGSLMPKQLHYSSNPGITLQDAAKIATVKNLSFCKADGSVPEGFEIVTHPVSIENPWPHLEPLWPRLQALAAHGFCGTEHTGLHIHVTKYPELAPFLKLMMYGNAISFWTKLSNRQDLKKLEQYASFSETGTRYQAVNETKETVELRFFQAEISVNYIQENIDLTRALLAFASLEAEKIAKFYNLKTFKDVPLYYFRPGKAIFRMFTDFIGEHQKDFPFAYRLLMRNKFLLT